MRNSHGAVNSTHVMRSHKRIRLFAAQLTHLCSVALARRANNRQPGGGTRNRTCYPISALWLFLGTLQYLSLVLIILCNVRVHDVISYFS